MTGKLEDQLRKEMARILAESQIKLSLIRHGKTKANEEKLYCGGSDPPLSEAGRQELLRRKETLFYPESAFLITSGLSRTKETAELLFENAGQLICTELAEIHFGDFEMRSYEELKNKSDYQDWIMQRSPAPPGGESRTQFKKRVMDALYSILKEAEQFKRQKLTVITHGGVIVTVMEYFFPGLKHFYQWQPDFGCGYCLTGVRGKIHYESIPIGNAGNQPIESNRKK